MTIRRAAALIAGLAWAASPAQAQRAELISRTEVRVCASFFGRLEEASNAPGDLRMPAVQVIDKARAVRRVDAFRKAHIADKKNLVLYLVVNATIATPDLILRGHRDRAGSVHVANLRV